MKFGASIWTFKWQAPYEDAIPRIAKLGLKGVELIAWTREVLDEYYTPKKIKELKSIIEGEGLELTEFVSSPRTMASPDKRERDKCVDHFKKFVEVGRELGTKIVNTVSAHPFAIEFPRITERPLSQEQVVKIPPGLDWKQNWEDYVEVMKRCAAICEGAGMKYALEPHPYRYMSNAASMLRLIDHVGSPALGMNFDPSHLFPSGEIPQMVIYQLGDRIFHTHLSDNDATTNAHWRPGKGKIDWEGVLRALKDVGYDGVLSIELEDVPGVSRRDRASTEELDGEYIKTKGYLTEICGRIGIRLE